MQALMNQKLAKLVLVFSLLGLSVSSYAKPDFYKKLDLTDEQKQVFKESRADKKKNREEMKSAMQAIKKRSLALMDNYSESEAQAIANDMANLAKEKTLSRLAHQQKIYNILDDSQKQTYKKMMAKHKGPFGHKCGKGKHRHHD